MKIIRHTTVTVEMTEKELNTLRSMLADHRDNLNAVGGRGATSNYLTDLAALMNGLSMGPHA